MNEIKNLQSVSGKNYRIQMPPLIRGGEGEICNIIGEPGLLAKIYHNKGLANEEKIYQMVRMENLISHNYIAWPLDALIEAGHITGFTMQKFANTKPLSELLSYSNEELSWEKRLFIARNLCDVVREVHAGGQCIGDMNPGNFGVDMKAYTVYAYDVDSFHLHTEDNQWYPCVVGIRNYFSPELQNNTMQSSLRSEDPRKTFTQNSDLFALGLLIFQLLFEGFHPFSCRLLPWVDSDCNVPGQNQNIVNGYSPWFEENTTLGIPLNAPSLDIVPPVIQQLFRRAFFSQERPGAEEWQRVIDEFLNIYLTDIAHRWGPRYEQPKEPEKKSQGNSEENQNRHHKAGIFLPYIILLTIAIVIVVIANFMWDQSVKNFSGLNNDWEDEYRNFIAKGAYDQYIHARDPELEEMMIERDRQRDEVSRYDFNDDNIPELLIKTDIGIDQVDVFTFLNSKITWLGSMGGDNFINYYVYFKNKQFDNAIYTFSGGPGMGINRYTITMAGLWEEEIGRTVLDDETEDLLGIRINNRTNVSLEPILWDVVNNTCDDANYLLWKPAR